jgi:hypothetical protein
VKVLVVVLVTAALCAAAGTGCQSRSQSVSSLELVRCGDVLVGKGWRVQATRSLDCASAREVISAFLELPRCLAAQRQPGTACTACDYRCDELALRDDVGQVRCTRSTHMVLARSNR